MKLGLIGGYGLEEIVENSKTETCQAQFEDEKIKGQLPNYGLIHGKISDKEVLIIPRHGPDHSFPPHNVPFKSYFQKFEQESVDKIITTNSVGVMNRDWEVPCLFLIEDFVNEGQEVTYHERFPDQPVHINLSHPYDRQLKQKIKKQAQELGFKLITDAVYVNSEGPRLETKAEISNKYSPLGDVIGMTGAKEAILANEKELPIASIGMGANKAEGMGDEAKIDDIIRETEKLQNKVYQIMRRVISNL